MTAKKSKKPLIIAGPCAAESPEVLHTVASFLVKLSSELDFDLVFKTSFDKANRTSIDSYRGPGIQDGLHWLNEIKKEFRVPVLTDVHETSQVQQVAEVCDYVQIPAFLCRQTDLLVECVKSGKKVNIKKGQFLAPESMKHITDKARATADNHNLQFQVTLTERGASFGYGNLVVDMRSFPIMANNGVPIIFDITHSLQLPGTAGTDGQVSGGDRRFAPILARAATATNYVDGFFLEVHPQPQSAKSDATTQLSLEQCGVLLHQLIPLWHFCKGLEADDGVFSQT